MAKAKSEPQDVELTKSDIASAALSFARNSLFEFTLLTFPTEFIPNWHHEILCEKLEALLEGEIKRLMVFMPPRHSKTELVARRFPAYALGKNPELNVIVSSYSAGLAYQINRDCQSIMETRVYNSVFPETVLPGPGVKGSDKKLCNSEVTEIIGGSGDIRAAGVGGGITGHGFDIGIIDDPIKNWEEAHSPVYREMVWNWFTTTFMTRCNTQEARVLITLTRWHEDDLAGRILHRMKIDPEFDRYEVVSLPAIKENDSAPGDKRKIGEALWPARFNLDYLNQRKKEGEYKFNALFQQKPSPPSGSIVNRDWWQYYDKEDLNDLMPNFEKIIQSWDMSFKETTSGSYVVGQVWGKIGADVYLLYQTRERLDFPRTLDRVRAVSGQWNTSVKLVEDKANGPAVISTLKHEIPGIIPVKADVSKELRAQAVSYLIKSGNVYVPRNTPWVNAADGFVEEWANFPHGSHDDQVDASAHAIKHLLVDVNYGDNISIDSV